MEDVGKVETGIQLAVVVYPPHLEQYEMIGCSTHSNHILSTKVFILKTAKIILCLKQSFKQDPETKQEFYYFQSVLGDTEH